MTQDQLSVCLCVSVNHNILLIFKSDWGIRAQEVKARVIYELALLLIDFRSEWAHLQRKDDKELLLIVSLPPSLAYLPSIVLI